MSGYRYALIFFVCLASSLTVKAQRKPEDHFRSVSQVRLDLRELGYPPADVIPSGESAVHALAVAPNGTVYGATSGKRAHLFALDPRIGYVQPLGYIPQASGVHRSLVVSRSGDVFLGTNRGVDNDGKGFEKYEGGHLWKYSPPSDQLLRPIRVDQPCDGLINLGVPVPGEAIYSLAIDRDRDTIYGLSYPHGRFFTFPIKEGKARVVGKVAEKEMPGELFENEKNVARAVVVDREGNVYASGEGGKLFRFDAKRQILEPLPLTAPTVPGREQYNRVDAWAVDSCGLLYGGTSDGYLFRLDPRSLRLTNLGKPLNQYRIRGLAWSSNGRLYGVGGDADEICRLFSYDPADGAYELLGMIEVNRRPFYTWQAYTIDAVILGPDETLYLGESERRSKLYLFYPPPTGRVAGCERPRAKARP